MESTGLSPMLEAVTTSLTSVLSWFGEVIKSLTTSDGALNALLPLFAVGIGVSLVMIVVKVVRSIVWGA